MSESINFEVIEDTDKELDDEAADILVDICQDSFSREGMPDKEDAEEHIKSVSKLLIAVDGESDEPVGFSSSLMLENDEDYLIQHGLAVDRDYQGERLGEILVDLVTLASTDADDVWLGGRTQSEFYINYIHNRYGFPRKVDTPEFFEEPLEEFKDFFPSKGSENHILFDTYESPNYSDEDIIEMTKNIQEFVNDKYNPYNGDGILALTHISLDKIWENYLSNKQKSEFKITFENFDKAL